MRNALAVLASLGVLGAVIYLAGRRRAASTLQPITVTAPLMVAPPATPWLPPQAAQPYLPTVYAAERANGIPHNLLARLLDQESHYRPDIISGATRSSAGAVGIAQLIPRYFPGVDPTNWIESINAAAAYLAKLHAQFGSWPLALAAYDWGPGNLTDSLAAGQDASAWPTETQAYVTAITRDVAVA